MKNLQKRDKTFEQLGFKNLNGEIKLVKRIEKAIPITSLSINIDNIFSEDIDAIIEEIKSYKHELESEFNNTINYIKQKN